MVSERKLTSSSSSSLMTKNEIVWQPIFHRHVKPPFRIGVQPKLLGKPFVWSFLTLTILFRTHLKFSNYLQQPLFGNGERNPKLCQTLF